MPPKRKNNKHKQIAQKKQITTRLMAISLQVDKYIYKNKHITISQAQMYLQELTSFKYQCLGDAPSLQVCEKLTRCMRGIIEEQQSDDAVLEDTDTFIELNHSSNLNAASHVYSLADEDKKQMASDEPDIQPENNNHNSCIKKSSIHEGNKENNNGLRKLVRFSIDDNTKVNKTPKINTEFNNENSHISNTNQRSNVDNELTEVIIDLTLQDIEQPAKVDEDLCSQSLLKNLCVESNEIPETHDEHFINDTCGQDMAEFDREIINLLELEAEGSIEHDKHIITPNIFPMTQNTPATVKDTPDIFKTPEVAEKRTELFNKTKTNKIINNKPIKDVKIQKKKTAKNKEEKPQKKRRITKADSNLTENDANTNNISEFTSLTNNSEVTLQASTNTIKESINRSIIGQEAIKNIEMRNVPNIVQISETKNSSNTVQIAGRNISTIDSTKIVCFEEDLSWVENITYVREIHLEEFDPALKPSSESFWDNCELPDNWDGRDFEWT